MAENENVDPAALELLKADLRKEMSKKVATWAIAGGIGVFTLAAIGAWTILKPAIADDLGVVTEDRVQEMIDNNSATTLASSFPSGAVVAFDGGAYEKTSNERLASGCPEGWVRFIQAEGRFILGSDSYPSSGETGDYELRAKDGSPTHTLTLNEIVNHTHGGRLVGTTLPPGEGHLVVLEPRTSYERSAGHSLVADNATGHPFPGKAKPHNNMPPYIALYFCKKEG